MCSYIKTNEIVDHYFQKKNIVTKNHVNDKIYNENFKQRTSEEIKNFLIESDLGETGGITALSGFYFQFLVTVEYIIELIEGKWDFLIMEHRDDVVVGNESLIRFIQVKSSQYSSCVASKKPASDLYTRKSKENKIYANSWIDKLFINSNKFYKENNIRTEFQLYTSYQILKAPQGMNVDLYSDNSNFNIEISLENDQLYKRMNVEIYDSKDILYNFEEKCGENLESLMQRLHVHSGNKLMENDKFERYLCHKLGGVILGEYGESLTVSKNDLKYFIGELFEKCTYGNGIDALVITRESINEPLERLKTSVLSSAEKAIESHSVIKIIQEETNEWIIKCEEMSVNQEIMDNLNQYSQYLQDWILNDGISFKTVIERLYGEKSYANTYINLSTKEKHTIISELLILVLVYKLVKNDELLFNHNESLLMKRAVISEDIHGLIRMKSKVRKNEAIIKLKEIITLMSLEEELKILSNKKLSVAFFNCIPRDFKKTESIKLSPQEILENTPTQKNNQSLIETDTTIRIYRGDVIDYFEDSLNEDDTQTFLINILKEMELIL